MEGVGGNRGKIHTEIGLCSPGFCGNQVVAPKENQ